MEVGEFGERYEVSGKSAFKGFRGRRGAGLQPRVLLERLKDDNTCSKFSSKSIEISKVVSTNKDVLHGGLMRLAALIYIAMSSPSFEDFHGYESTKYLTIVDLEIDDIQDKLNSPTEQSTNFDDRNIKTSCLVVEDDNFKLQDESTDVKSEISVQIKQNLIRNFNIATAIHEKSVEIAIAKNNNKKLKRKRKIKRSIKPLRYHCTLCKTSYSSYGRLRKHKNNVLHRFLKRKTLTIFVNRERRIRKVGPTNKIINDQDNNDGGTKVISENSNCQRYNWRRPQKNLKYSAPKDDQDENSLDEDFSNDISNFNSNHNTSSSSSETSDTDDDNDDIKPNVSKTSGRIFCPEVKCGRNFLTIKELRTHSSLHGNFACQFCNISLNYAPDLGYHESQMHTDANASIKQKEFNKSQLGHTALLKCSRCSQSFLKRIAHTHHFVNKHLNISHERNVEGQHNSNKTNTYPRLQLPSKVTKFNCSICALEMPSGPELANHEANHQKNSKKYVTCPRCKKYIPRVKYTGHFMISHLGANQKHQKIQCNICESKVTRLDQHYKRFHKTTDTLTKIYKCDEGKCAAYFINATQLIRHKRNVHVNEFDCKYCGKKILRKKSLRNHINLLHPEKRKDPSLPIACDRDHCKKRFGTDAELEWHQKWDKHDNEKDEKICKKCGKQFASKGLLNTHLKNICADVGSVICQICGKGFKTKIYLKIHLQYHKGPDGYNWQCTTCGKKFMKEYMLKDHMTSHSDEKKWVCQWCGEKYGYRRSWLKHVLKIHKDEEGLPEVRKTEGVNRISRKGARPRDFVMAGVRK